MVYDEPVDNVDTSKVFRADLAQACSNGEQLDCGDYRREVPLFFDHRRKIAVIDKNWPDRGPV